MSSGADSAVAAALLKEQGCEVLGLTFRLSGAGAESIDAVLGAERVAVVLGVEHRVVDVQVPFESAVSRYLDHELGNGRGPYGGVAFWFPKLLDAARAHGCDTLATGHYARLMRGADGRVRLLRARDVSWDQSWRLVALDSTALGCARFPLGEMLRDDVLSFARRRGLPVAPAKPPAPELIEPDAGFTNRPVIGTAFILRIHWLGDGQRTEAFRGVVRTRRLHAGFPARIVPLSPDTAQVEFEEAPFGVMPGQPAAIYIGDEVVAGGWVGHL
jgi:tRNA U34 2-thiouridine synthase MnmA/TrmU